MVLILTLGTSVVFAATNNAAIGTQESNPSTNASERTVTVWDWRQTYTDGLTWFPAPPSHPILTPIYPKGFVTQPRADVVAPEFYIVNAQDLDDVELAALYFIWLQIGDAYNAGAQIVEILRQELEARIYVGFDFQALNLSELTRLESIWQIIGQDFAEGASITQYLRERMVAQVSTLVPDDFIGGLYVGGAPFTPVQYGATPLRPVENVINEIREIMNNDIANHPEAANADVVRLTPAGAYSVRQGGLIVGRNDPIPTPVSGLSHPAWTFQVVNLQEMAGFDLMIMYLRWVTLLESELQRADITQIIREELQRRDICVKSFMTLPSNPIRTCQCA